MQEKLFLRVFSKLKEYHFSEAVIAHKDPYKVLVAAMLSARTRDENTEKAVKYLFNRYCCVEEIANAKLVDLEKLIKPTGFYRIKARNLRRLSRILLKKYSGNVPKSLKELKELPGVGQKVAQCVRVFAFGEDAIPVDTHVHRISNRLGWVKTKTPDDTEQELMKTIPQRYWKEINNLLVKFGQNVCKPIAPLCMECKIRKFCRYFQTKYT